MTNIPIEGQITWICKRINHQWTRQHSQEMALLPKIKNQTTGVHSSQISQPQIVIQEAISKKTRFIIGKAWKFLSKKAHTNLRRGLQCCAGTSVIATSRTAGSSLPCRTLTEEDSAMVVTNSSLTTWMQILLVRRLGQQELPTLQKEGLDQAQSPNLSQSSQISEAPTFTSRQPWTPTLIQIHLVKILLMTEQEWHAQLAVENSTKWPSRSMWKSARKFSCRKDRPSTWKLLEHLKVWKKWNKSRNTTNHSARKPKQNPRKIGPSRVSQCPNGRRSLSCSDRRWKPMAAARKVVVEIPRLLNSWQPMRSKWMTVSLANFAIESLLRSLVKDTFLIVRGSIKKTSWKTEVNPKLLPREALK